MSSKPGNGKENLEVKIFTQSYREAKESGIVSELEAIGIVTGYCDANLHESPFCGRVIDVANNWLIRNAAQLGADYVFGIDYKVHDRENMRSTLVYGDCYRNPNIEKWNLGKNPKA